jgi:hypothetical protein
MPLDTGIKEVLYTAAGTSLVLGGLNAVRGGGSLNYPNLAMIGAGAAVGEYAADMINGTDSFGVRSATVAPTDADRYVRTVGAALGAGGVSYYLNGGNVSDAAISAAAGVAGHLASQYYLWGGIYF